MCCGAGGGLLWLEEETGHRINVSRTEQALAVNPTVISFLSNLKETRWPSVNYSQSVNGKVLVS